MRAFLIFLLVLSTLSPLPAVIVGRRTRKVLWYYAFITLLIDLPATVMVLNKVGAEVLYNLFLLFQFLIIPLAFWKYQVLGHGFRIPLILVMIALSGYFAYGTSRSSWHELNYNDAALFYLIFIILCLCGLFKVIHEIPVLRIERSPLFIFSASFLLYAAGSIIILKMKDPIQETDPQFLRRLWIVHNMLNVFKNLAIAQCLRLRNNPKI